MIEKDFWKHKTLEQMTEEEWEALCDKCGKCCYRKIIEGFLFRKRFLQTKVACNLLDLNTQRCSNYQNRCLLQKDCTKITPQNIGKLKWLPKTCAYRFLKENKDLPPFHPLVTGNDEALKKYGIMIEGGIHEEDVTDWDLYIIE